MIKICDTCNYFIFHKNSGTGGYCIKPILKRNSPLEINYDYLCNNWIERNNPTMRKNLVKVFLKYIEN